MSETGPALREVPAPTRGSGAVTCCGGHRERCTFGRIHSWSTWFENGKLQRTGATYHCLECGGICTAEEAERIEALERLARELASFTQYPPEPNVKAGPCAACGYEVDAGKGLIALGSDQRGTYAATLHAYCVEESRRYIPA